MRSRQEDNRHNMSCGCSGFYLKISKESILVSFLSRVFNGDTIILVKPVIEPVCIGILSAVGGSGGWWQWDS